MKRKQLSLFLAAATLSIAVSAPALATEPTDTTDNVAVEIVNNEEDASGQTESSEETEAVNESEELTEENAAEEDAAEEDAAEEETAEEETAEEETESKGDFVEGSAVLNDYQYEEGELTEDGWNNNFLNMSYIPGKDISMGIAENDQLASYYERNGEAKQVAINEMVAVDNKEGYVQLMVEVNPNKESAEDILERFCDNEEFTLASDHREMEIAGKTFLTCTGVVDRDRFLIGVCTDEDDFVIALKVKYTNTVARRALLDGFDVIETTETETEDIQDEDIESDVEEESEPETEEGIIMPAEFENGEIFESEETETMN